MYKVAECSVTGHCCFEASVVDREGVILCETFDIEDAKMIADALNNVKDKTKLQSEASVTQGLSSNEGAMLHRLIMLPVNTETGQADYDYIQYDVRNIEETQQEQNALIDGWEFKPFKVIPVINE